MWEDRSERIDHYGPLIWQQVSEDISALISSGELGPGAKLPGESELASSYGIARVTVRRAIEDLRNRGLVVTAHGKGTFVLPVN